MRSIRALILIALTSTGLLAQTIDDGFLMSRRVLATGVVYSRWNDGGGTYTPRGHWTNSAYTLRFAQQDGAN
jgi:hypothetical protein